MASGPGDSFPGVDVPSSHERQLTGGVPRRSAMSSIIQHERVACPVVGVVIAGGRSVRFGGEKAVALLAGTPLLLWATRRLQRSCRTVAVSARPGTQTAALAHAQGLPVLRDAPGDAAGPLAGVKAALSWAQDLGVGALAVSPCDAPLLPHELFPRLISCSSGRAALADTADGPQTLCAVWPTSALAKVANTLAAGAHPPMWSVLESIGAVRVRFADAAAFANVNTREDLAAVAARLEVS